ncbi:MAG: efflux RND transporter permease subunit [Eubacteriales bacterium]|nr:efflux RND transporter permease subunit [Eubacteriales bacterium]
MNFSKLAIKHPVTTAMMVLIIILVGFVSLIGIPADLLPEIELPVAIVFVQYPNAAPEEVETMVTKPLEQALASVENMDSIASLTTEGTSIVMVQFALKTDMDFATLDMREKISMVESFLPEDSSQPMVLKMNMDFTPVVQVYVSGDMPLAELNYQVENQVLSYLERTPGVASVDNYGGIEEEVSIRFDQEKLAGYDLTLSTISQLLAAENINLPSGEVSKGSTKMIVRTMGEFSSIDEIKQLPIPLKDRSIIYLSDLASIEQGYQEQNSISRVDTMNAIGLSITKQSTANTVDVSNEVADTLETLNEKFPDLTFTVGFDQADYIKSSISSVAKSALIGGILAILIIFLFLRNASSTLIIAISIPTSFFATFALMNLTGMTLNLITLSALTLAVGMLVDNSIVALENIFRVSTDEKGLSSFDAALIGSKQIALAVSASTLTSIVVYLPIALSSGIASMLFDDFCWTFIIALSSSLIIALSVVPMLSSKLLNRGTSLNYLRIGKRHYSYRLIPYFTRLIDWLTIYYEEVISKALKHRKKVVLICLLIFILSSALIGVVGMEFLPASDEAMFTVNIDTPYGTSLKEKSILIKQIEDYILALPELKHCTADIGLTSSFIGGETSSLSVTLIPKQNRERSIWEIIDDVEKKFQTLTGAEISVIESSSVTQLMGGSDITISVKGPDLNTLRTIGEDLSKKFLTVPGVAKTSTSIVEGSPEVKVILDRGTAAFYGITAYQLASNLDNALSGTTSTKLKIDGKEIDVNLSLSDTYKDSIDNMQQILIPTPMGSTVPVGQITNLEFGNSPSRIDRIDQQRYISINIAIDGDDLAGVSKGVFANVDNYPFPDGYTYDDGGLYEQMTDAFGDLLLALLVAILLVYMVLASQFESLTQPFIVMMSIPFSMSGAFLALFFTGKTLSVTSFLGLIMLVGIVVNNSILLIEFIRQNKTQMDRNQAIILAGKYRLRPILMTTITTCVGMIPLSLGLGDGGEILSPLGVSIIGGLIGSTLVTLILIPVLYSIADDGKIKRQEKKEYRSKEIQALEESWKKER